MPEFNRPWITIALLLTTGILFGSGIFAAIKIVEKSSRITPIKPTPLYKDANESVSSTPIPKWKRFESTEFGITLNYPTNWPEPEVLQLLQGVKINLNDILFVSNSKNLPTDLSFRDYMIGEIKGKIATVEKPDGTIEVTIVLPHPYAKDQFLIITYLEKPETADVVAEILSTVELMEKTEIAPTVNSLNDGIKNVLEPTSTIEPPKTLLSTPTSFNLPTPDPTTFNATEAECVYGCIPERKFK